MKNSEIIETFQKAQNELDEIHRPILVSAIKNELSKLAQGERIPVNSHNCDGFGIATGTYSDAFNFVDKDGNTIVYNNNECEGTIAHDEDGSSIFDMSPVVLVEVLENCIKYNRAKQDDLENLQVILESLDPESELYISMTKAIKKFKEA